MVSDPERPERFTTATPALRRRRDLVDFARRRALLGVMIAALLAALETPLGAGDVVMALGMPNTLDRPEALFVTGRTPVTG